MKRILTILCCIGIVLSTFSCIRNSLPDETESPNDNTELNTDLVLDSEKDSDDTESPNTNAPEAIGYGGGSYTRISFDDTKPVKGLYPFAEQVSLMERLYGLIDSNGAIVVPLKYVIASPSSEGFAVVRIDCDDNKIYRDPLGQKHWFPYVKTYVNIQGEECFGYFTEANDFHEGIAFVRDANYNHHAIDTQGNILHSWDKNDVYIIYDFCEGLARFETYDWKCGFMNKDFEIVIEPIFDDAMDFSEGLAAVSVDGQLEYIDKTGQIIFQTGTSYDWPVDEGTFWSRVYETEDGDLLYGNGDYWSSSFWVFNEYLKKRSFSEGLACIYDPKEPIIKEVSKKDPKNYRYIDSTGRTVLDQTIGSQFSHGLAVSCEAGEEQKLGYINQNGEFVIPGQYWDAFPFNEDGVALVAEYEEHFAKDEMDDRLYVRNPHRLGYINTKGEVIIPIEYYSTYDEQIDRFEANGVIELHKNGYTYFFNTEGQLLGKNVESQSLLEWIEANGYKE